MSWTDRKDGAITTLSNKGMNLTSHGPDWRLAGYPQCSTDQRGRDGVLQGWTARMERGSAMSPAGLSKGCGVELMNEESSICLEGYIGLSGETASSARR